MGRNQIMLVSAGHGKEVERIHLEEHRGALNISAPVAGVRPGGWGGGQTPFWADSSPGISNTAREDTGLTDPGVLLSSLSSRILRNTSISYRGILRGLVGRLVSHRAGSRHKPLFEKTPMRNFLYNAILGKSRLLSVRHYVFFPSLTERFMGLPLVSSPFGLPGHSGQICGAQIDGHSLVT